jgi:hypothetical protein
LSCSPSKLIASSCPYYYSNILVTWEGTGDLCKKQGPLLILQPSAVLFRMISNLRSRTTRSVKALVVSPSHSQSASLMVEKTVVMYGRSSVLATCSLEVNHHIRPVFTDSYNEREGGESLWEMNKNRTFSMPPYQTWPMLSSLADSHQEKDNLNQISQTYSRTSGNFFQFEPHCV